MTKKKVQIRLNGDSSQKYNFGTVDKEDWKDGGTVLDVSAEAAKDLVTSKKIAHYVDETEQPASENVVAPGSSSDMKFDQDVESVPK